MRLSRSVGTRPHKFLVLNTGTADFFSLLILLISIGLFCFQALYLSAIGGASVRDAVKNIFKKLMCPRLAVTYTFTGKNKEKGVFKDLKNVVETIYGENFYVIKSLLFTVINVLSER